MSGRLALLARPWRDRVDAAVAFLTARGFAGDVGVILGSGLGNFVDRIADARVAPYGEIPGYHATSVAAHQGRLVGGIAAGVRTVAMQGRLHPYEGLAPADLLLPTAVLACLGVRAVVVTNAAGGLNRFYAPGDLMVIRDQIDLHWDDPLRGLLADPLGAAGRVVGRVPPPAHLYDPALASALAAAAARAGVPVHQGVYASMWGPTYETKAEIGLLRRAGCDAVGMSTAAEVALLSALGVAVAGLSCITNPARETGQPELSHQDVVAVGARVRERVAAVLLAVLGDLA
ncbi:MAG TPA: purine-nucleoside phosphorylase [Candidatus Krumholzibacteria bacterium]|nr:purine-nucleoside phosphorylase [Candidatus Krumholzibacteria bacterium]HPD71871.1 purine-nucleoside phosphorylase [Candidatus Krumholzibacteria bacterium]HRY41196.1 purine-nucleoside phosphorylase [Candidatus Krumholzibacteria bacterium]